MAKRLLVGLLAVMAGCSDAPDPLRELRADSVTPIKVRTVHGLVRDVSGAFEGLDAPAFLAKHAALFGVDDVATELGAPVTTSDGASGTVTYPRLTSGVPVHGAEIRLHTVDGSVVLVTAPLPSDASIASPEPALTPAEAAERLGATPVVATELVGFNHGLFDGEAAPTVLAYHVRSVETAGFVDAGSGEVLLTYPVLQFARDRRVAHYQYQPGCGGVGCSIENIVDFAHEVWFVEAGSLPDVTPSAQGSLLFSELGDLHDYYAGRFGRDGIDGRGGQIRAFLNHPTEATTSPAFWSPDEQAIFLRDQYVSPEAIAHEYGHGVVMASSALGSSGESGALHEAFADILAVLANGGSEWAIREADDTIIRDLARPVIEQYGSYIPLADSDHDGSGPFSLATYLLAVGDTEITPIAITKLEQIYYRTITRYLQPRSDMEDALFGLVRSCVDLWRGNLFGVEPADCGSIWNAFAAVGLGERDDDRDIFPNSVDNCDRYNPEQTDADGNDVGDECESTGGSFPAAPPAVPTCLPVYHGATIVGGEWVPEDWPLIAQSEVEVFDLYTPGYHEFRLVCSYDCFACGTGGGVLTATVTWQPYDPADYGLPLAYPYEQQCQLPADAITGQIGPFYSSTHLANILLGFGRPDNPVYNDEQTRYLDAMLTVLETHAASCP